MTHQRTIRYLKFLSILKMNAIYSTNRLNEQMKEDYTP